MEQKNDNLWPKDFGAPEKIPPVTILRQQAAFLGQLTKNLVEAEVKTTSSGGTEARFVHYFSLVAPALDFYTHCLFFITHDIGFYPLRFITENPHRERDIASEEELRRVLHEVLTSEETKKVVQSLLSQSMAGVE